MEFVIKRDGNVILVPATVDVKDLKGLLAPAPRRLSVKQMDAAIRRRAAALGRLTATEAMADIYRTLPEDTAATWQTDSRRTRLMGERIAAGPRKPSRS